MVYVDLNQSCWDERAEGERQDRTAAAGGQDVVSSLKGGEQVLSWLPRTELFKIWFIKITGLLGLYLSCRHLVEM